MKIALIGNQNSGKTTLFNLLTGFNSKVGNYPGVTIEKKSGYIKDTNYELVDLPGIYSLSSYSVDENITINFLLNEKPNLIINIIDSTNFQRSLYLTTQLLELNIRVILVLNMNDLLLKKGIIIDENKLSNILNIDVIKISALKNYGIDKLIESINCKKSIINNKIFDNTIEDKINKIESIINNYNKRFISIKLLEEDSLFIKYKTNEIDYIINSLRFRYGCELYEEIINQRYNYIENIKNKVFYKSNNISLSDKIDKIILNKYLSIPIFIIIMFFIYYLSIDIIGTKASSLISTCFNNFSIILNRVLDYIGVSKWIISLIVDGIISGISSVLVFIPSLIILFFCLAIIESCGYMSRISMIFDSLFKKIGLSGKSIVPFIIGLGCSTPGILSSRIIENTDTKDMTSMLIPFIPCSAKLPIIVMMSSFFYKNNKTIIIMSFYLLSILIIIITSVFMKKYIYKTSYSYIEELVEYKSIDFKYIINDVYDKINSFIKRAGSIIFISSIIVWFLSSFSFNLEYGVELSNSIICQIGKKISWIFYPFLGVNSWECSISIIQGLIAKEQVISSLTIINNLNTNELLTNIFNKYSAYSFIVFNLFSIPCLSTLITLKKELKSYKKIILLILYQFFIAYIISILIYQILVKNYNLLVIGLLIFIICIIIRKNFFIKKCNKCIYNNNCIVKKNND